MQYYIRLKSAGKPRFGELYTAMCRSRRLFKRKLSSVKRNEREIFIEKVTNSKGSGRILEKDSIWDETNKGENCCKDR